MGKRSHMDSYGPPRLQKLAGNAFLDAVFLGEILDDFKDFLDPDQVQDRLRKCQKRASKNLPKKPILTCNSWYGRFTDAFLIWLGFEGCPKGHLYRREEDLELEELYSGHRKQWYKIQRHCYDDVVAFGNFLHTTEPYLITRRDQLEKWQHELQQREQELKSAQFFLAYQRAVPTVHTSIELAAREMERDKITKEQRSVSKDLATVSAEQNDFQKHIMEMVKAEPERRQWHVPRPVSPETEKVALRLASNFCAHLDLTIKVVWVPCHMPYKISGDDDYEVVEF